MAYSHTRLSNNRSVMPLDVRGRTRATLILSKCVVPSPEGLGNPQNPNRARDWGLQLFPMNEEFLVSASHQLVLIASLPFVHTARRYYRSFPLMNASDWSQERVSACSRRAGKTCKFTGIEVVKVVTRYP